MNKKSPLKKSKSSKPLSKSPAKQFSRKPRRSSSINLPPASLKHLFDLASPLAENTENAANTPVTARRSPLTWHGAIADKHLGQHFLIDQDLVDRIAASCLPREADGDAAPTPSLTDLPADSPTTQHTPQNHAALYLEIGPGLGILTEAIVRIIQPPRLVAIEQDRRFIQHLKAILTNYPQTQSQVILGDALQLVEADLLGGAPCSGDSNSINTADSITNLDRFNDTISPNKTSNSIANQSRPNRHTDSTTATATLPLPTKIVLFGNLPYNIATALLFKWFRSLDLFAAITVMLQREVARRLIATPKSKEYGWLSVITQLLCSVEMVVDRIAPSAFWPAPKVESAVVQLRPLPLAERITAKEWAILDFFIKPAFNYRRKTLRNVFIKINQDTKRGPNRDTNSAIDWETYAAAAGVSLEARPEEIDPQTWRHLAALVAAGSED